MHKKIFIHLFAVFQSGIFINTSRAFISKVGEIQFLIYFFPFKEGKMLKRKTQIQIVYLCRQCDFEISYKLRITRYVLIKSPFLWATS